jgi:hypothetical protein
MAAKIDTGTDNRCVQCYAKGQFTESARGRR